MSVKTALLLAGVILFLLVATIYISTSNISKKSKTLEYSVSQVEVAIDENNEVLFFVKTEKENMIIESKDINLLEGEKGSGSFISITEYPFFSVKEEDRLTINPEKLEVLKEEYSDLTSEELWISEDLQDK